MPQLKTYNLFISHSWAYGDAYEKLVSFFDEHPNFKWVDYSVPKDDPIHNANNDYALQEAIKKQMQNCHSVLILAGVYSSYSKWIQKEIVLAQNGFSLCKQPIIAIEPWGSEKTSMIVKQKADKIVKWNADSIVSVVKALA